jgi:hypothetical protein
MASPRPSFPACRTHLRRPPRPMVPMHGQSAPRRRRPSMTIIYQFVQFPALDVCLISASCLLFPETVCRPEEQPEDSALRPPTTPSPSPSLSDQTSEAAPAGVPPPSPSPAVPTATSVSNAAAAPPSKAAESHVAATSPASLVRPSSAPVAASPKVPAVAPAKAAPAKPAAAASAALSKPSAPVSKPSAAPPVVSQPRPTSSPTPPSPLSVTRDVSPAKPVMPPGTTRPRTASSSMLLRVLLLAFLLYILMSLPNGVSLAS